MHAVFRLLRRALRDDVQDRIHAVLHVEIGFALLAVAEHAQVIGVLEKLPVKIEDMPVRVAFAEDRDEAEDVALEPEALAIRLNEIFTRDL